LGIGWILRTGRILLGVLAGMREISGVLIVGIEVESIALNL
jgi:hypothetical protein